MVAFNINLNVLYLSLWPSVISYHHCHLIAVHSLVPPNGNAELTPPFSYHGFLVFASVYQILR